MAISTRLKVGIAVALATTLGIKLVIAGGIANPTNAEIAAAAEPFFVSQGFQSAGQALFADRVALLLSRDACLLYAVPVAPQGWHEALLRFALQNDQILSFVYKGAVRRDTQERWRPLLTYYVKKALRYASLPTEYDPVFALVQSGACDVNSIDWARMPAVPFKRVGFLN